MRSIGYYFAVLALAGGLATCNKDKGPEGPTDFSGGCEAVDLGLGVKWASYNVGALNVDDRGSYLPGARPVKRAITTGQMKVTTSGVYMTAAPSLNMV